MLHYVRRNLSPGGIVKTYPNLFTGITGGHDPDWYSYRVEPNGPEDAWRNLRDDTVAVDTYLNRIGRRDMAALFQECGFRIMRVHAVLGRLGERHLTPKVAARRNLRYDDFELFKSCVEFILSADELHREGVP